MLDSIEPPKHEMSQASTSYPYPMHADGPPPLNAPIQPGLDTVKCSSVLYTVHDKRRPAA